MTTPGLGPADKRVHVVFRGDEHVMLLDLVKASGLSITDVLRQLVRNAHGVGSLAYREQLAAAGGPKKATRR